MGTCRTPRRPMRNGEGLLERPPACRFCRLLDDFMAYPVVIYMYAEGTSLDYPVVMRERQVGDDSFAYHGCFVDGSQVLAVGTPFQRACVPRRETFSGLTPDEGHQMTQ